MEYPEYFAKFYDTIYAKIRDGIDNEYFLSQIHNTNGKILEVGVGTGRFFKQALNEGADIYGIDVSQNMLNILKTKIDKHFHERIFLQDITQLNFNTSFDLIIAPFRVFSHLITIEQQLLALEKIYDHLKCGGKFIFDLFVPNIDWIKNGINLVDFEGEYEPGLKLKRTSIMQSDLVNQVNNVTMQFDWETTEGIKTASWDFKMRYYFRYEIEHLIARSPLKLEAIYGDYKENPLNKDSKDFVVVCKK